MSSSSSSSCPRCCCFVVVVLGGGGSINSNKSLVCTISKMLTVLILSHICLNTFSLSMCFPLRQDLMLEFTFKAVILKCDNLPRYVWSVFQNRTSASSGGFLFLFKWVLLTRRGQNSSVKKYTICPLCRLLFSSSSASMTWNRQKAENHIFRWMCSSHVSFVWAFALTRLMNLQQSKNKQNSNAESAAKVKHSTKIQIRDQNISNLTNSSAYFLCIVASSKKQTKNTSPPHQPLVWTFLELISITLSVRNPGSLLSTRADAARHTWNTSPCSMLRFCLIKALWIKHEVIIVAPDTKRSRECRI